MRRKEKKNDALRTLSKNPKRIYLFGNGINNGVKKETAKNSWEDILNTLNHEYAADKIDAIKKKPFPLAYDEIINYNFNLGKDDEVRIKTHIQELIQLIPSNDRYLDLKYLNFDEILTTNYDYNFEKSIHKGWERKKNYGHQETSYSCYRHQEVGGKLVWHIHGEQDARGSILLGFRHYISYASRLKEEVHKQLQILKDTNQKKRIKKKDPATKPIYDSWATYFFTEHVRIVGLSMKQTEYPLYWILAHRYFLQQSHENYIIENKIEYLIPSFSIGKNRQILEALTSYGVIIRVIDIDKIGDYDSFYKKVMNNETGKTIDVYRDKEILDIFKKYKEQANE